MVKKQKIDLKNVGLLILAGFVWSKLGVGTAVKDVGVLPPLSRDIPLKPDGTCPAGWIKTGNRCIKL